MNADQLMLELAGLLRAGLPATKARGAIADKLPQISNSQSVQFEAIWNLAIRLGGSVAAAIENLGQSFTDQQRHQREIDLAFAGPKATARLVNVLPIAGLGLAQLLGMDPMGAIFTTPLGFISVALACMLMILGRFWSQGILKKAKPSEHDPGIYFEAVRVGLSAGLSIRQAQAEAVLELGRYFPEPVSPSDLAQLENLIVLTRTSGASLVDLVTSTAKLTRQELRYREATVIAALSVRLMIPLGVVVLPAFVLSTIAPIAISLLSKGQN